MSEQPDGGASSTAAERPGGFFGSGEPLPAEAIDSEVLAEIDAWLDRHAGGQERLIPLLHRIQEDLGYVPFPVQDYVAGKLGMSAIQVYGVVSFYHFFTTTPRGEHQLKVCMGTACFVRQGQRLVDTIRDLLKIEVGETTEDRLFSLEQVRCLGACGLAPAMMVNSEVHGNLTPKNVRKLVTRLRTRARKAEREARKAAEAEEGNGV
jgi:NADH-quinone oxidoreductase subunit E/NADP-reducing hydrogenase subunit HndA